ncbi:MAG: hypothetical protein IPP25_04495 [Saprospiraceae bacterium]|nr:hypothetical protein [Candidatus Opimibacter skivensis]
MKFNASQYKAAKVKRFGFSGFFYGLGYYWFRAGKSAFDSKTNNKSSFYLLSKGECQGYPAVRLTTLPAI